LSDSRKNLLQSNIARPRLASAWAIGKLGMADVIGMAGNKIRHVFAQP
jgi:hypothetical protein